ncbi:hypothetical protein A2Z33_00915 [Candidatus Gottesmanbacteria bacterium RBG_16_52_11]|uniref:Mannosyl-glycoprotein endo-beta-N-acetylglucosamidase-like domain-containing protein n=1 Tax=Candidatus Gottesmanbacteria bacterium RBG_16_52_11 TaxID=1798374 RepID=A0A1F5YP98_9BACT|nr:MAG: hypothetical protein A2Z33_00915 [Candidatus Gottesmanbacteria bacterium RBG_16_52_11]
MLQKIIFGAFLLAILTFPQGVRADLTVGKSADLVANQPQADQRVPRLESYLARHNPEIASKASVFVREADKYSLDWKLVAAIAGLESTFCRFIPDGSYNCWGWGIPSGAPFGVGFSSFDQGIATVSEGLRKRYVDRGLITVEEIGQVYAASPTWASRVRYFMDNIETYAMADTALSLELLL